MLIRVAMLLVFLWSGVAGAATLTVEAVVSPAWVERAGGAREALMAGAVLRNGDRVLTEAGARALLRMAEGSAVKLGENASLGVDQLTDRSGAAGRIVSGVLDVAQGAFRFTTRFLTHRAPSATSISASLPSPQASAAPISGARAPPSATWCA